MENSFYSENELKQLGLKKFGTNVLISKKTSIYGAERITIGNNVRVDDFCILSGQIKIGSYVHIAAGVYIFAGDYGIILEDFVGISSRCALYASTDDYSGESLTNPMIPNDLRRVIGNKIVLKKHSLVGSGCTILPGVTIEEGAAIGSMSLVNNNIDAFTINVGVPCKKIKDRKKTLLDKEAKL